jgi:hypothetical protein
MKTISRYGLGVTVIGVLTILLLAQAANADTPLAPPAVGAAFPAQTAGISAYAKIDQPLDLEKTKVAFRDFVSVGANFLVGVVEVPNFGRNTRVHVYVDDQGWVVAFLPKGEPTAGMMQWLPADINQPVIASITGNVLLDAIRTTTGASGISFLPAVGYYHFGYPEATELTLFVRTVVAPKTPKYSSEPGVRSGASMVQFEIPGDHRLFEASYDHYSFDLAGSALHLNSDTENQFNTAQTDNAWAWRTNLLPEVEPGALQTIEIQYVSSAGYNYDYWGSAGVAVVLLYAKGTAR